MGAALLAIGGIALPLFLSTQSSGRVDKAIQEMRDGFKELAGEQLRKPDLKFFKDGQEINSLAIEYLDGKIKNPPIIIYIKNDGNALASNISVRLYRPEKGIKFRGAYWFNYSNKSDESDFNEIDSYSIRTEFGEQENFILTPKTLLQIEFDYSFDFTSQNTLRLLVKVYSQREPISLPITVRNTTP